MTLANLQQLALRTPSLGAALVALTSTPTHALLTSPVKLYLSTSEPLSLTILIIIT